MPVTPWTLIEDDLDPFGFVHVVGRRYQLPDGREAEWDIQIRPDAVVVVALTPANKVVMIREFRPGPNAVLTDLPSGFVNPGESPIDAAIRELREESGYSADELIEIGSFWHAGSSTMRRHTFLARNAQRTHAQDLDDGEAIDVLTMPFDQFVAHVRQGDMTSADCALMAIDWLREHPD